MCLLIIPRFEREKTFALVDAKPALFKENNIAPKLRGTD
jgi:hypothetical protein